jgi:hypothetical protein
MRLLVEILVVGALIYLGWEKPFKDWTDDARWRLTGKRAEVAPTRPAPTPAPRVVPGIQGLSAPTPHGAWRLDPNHRSPLDPPPRSASPY